VIFVAYLAWPSGMMCTTSPRRSLVRAHTIRCPVGNLTSGGACGRGDTVGNVRSASGWAACSRPARTVSPSARARRASAARYFLGLRRQQAQCCSARPAFIQQLVYRTYRRQDAVPRRTRHSAGGNRSSKSMVSRHDGIPQQSASECCKSPRGGAARCNDGGGVQPGFMRRSTCRKRGRWRFISHAGVAVV
jgi:hypothetical protein